MRISDWSSDVCSSDLRRRGALDPDDLLGPVGIADVVVQDAVAVEERGRARGGGGRHVLGSRAGSGAGGSGAVTIGRASCRERVRTSVLTSVDAVSLKQKPWLYTTSQYHSNQKH